MAQSSRCHKCGENVVADTVSDDRAYFQCSCGNRWSSKAYFGRNPRGGAAAAGGILGTAITGGLDGGLIGAFVGALMGGDSSSCIKYDGTGYPTGRKGNRKGYQCSSCKSFWTERV